MLNILELLALAIAAIGAALVLYTIGTARKVEAALPPIGRFVDVPGARLHVVERGEGPPILLVHGLAGLLWHYTYALVDLLAKDYRVVVLDRPGSGYSVRAPGASAAVGAQADVLAALIDTLKLGRPLVVGHSLGGAIALALAQRCPDKVAGLALIAPFTHPVAQVPTAFRGMVVHQPWLRTLLGWTLAVPMGVIVSDKVVEMVFAPDPAPADFATRGGGLLSLRPSQYISASADLVASPDDIPGMVERYPSMRLPVSILYGRNDQVLNPHDNGETLAAEIPGATLKMVDGGHMQPISAPERTAQFIRDAAARAKS